MKYLPGLSISVIILLICAGTASAQENMNRTDENGMKQGQWKKRYDNGELMYEGYFIDNEPRGEFKRYDEKGNLVSVLNYRAENDTVDALFYHNNGYLAGKGKYYQKSKTGRWKYFSEHIQDHLLMGCVYSDDRVEGMRVKYHWNGNIAEEMEFENGIKSGYWKQYYTDGSPSLEGSFTLGKRDGVFITWHTNGEKEIAGRYTSDLRTGKWLFYNKDGSLRKEIVYNNGIPENRAELIKQETDYLDRLEREGGKLEDPEITGIIKK